MKKNYQQNIIDLLETRFNNCPESVVKAIKQIDDLDQLKQLFIDTIKINSLSEFEQLMN